MAPKTNMRHSLQLFSCDMNVSLSAKCRKAIPISPPAASCTKPKLNPNESTITVGNLLQSNYKA